MEFIDQRYLVFLLSPFSIFSSRPTMAHDFASLYGSAPPTPTTAREKLLCGECRSGSDDDNDTVEPFVYDSDVEIDNHNGTRYPYLCCECGRGFFITKTDHEHAPSCSYHHASTAYVTPRPVVAFKDPNDYCVPPPNRHRRSQHNA